MKRRRYPLGTREDRIIKLLEYIATNPGRMRMTVQAHMNHVYKSTLSSSTVSDYLKSLSSHGIIEAQDGRFFITKKGKVLLEKSVGKPR